MEIHLAESYLSLAGSGHLKTGTWRQRALGLSSSITAPVVCKETSKSRCSCSALASPTGSFIRYSWIGIWSDVAADSSPRLISPMSFFFGPFPKLLLRDHEKKIPRFLSALSSRASSFKDLPDLCFLASCWLKPNKALTYCTIQL